VTEPTPIRPITSGLSEEDFATALVNRQQMIDYFAQELDQQIEKGNVPRAFSACIFSLDPADNLDAIRPIALSVDDSMSWSSVMARAGAWLIRESTN